MIIVCRVDYDCRTLTSSDLPTIAAFCDNWIHQFPLVLVTHLSGCMVLGEPSDGASCIENGARLLVSTVTPYIISKSLP